MLQNITEFGVMNMSSVALLRGINLGKKNKVDMKSLKSLFEQMAYTNVRTYIQTGNVLFEGTSYDIQQIETLLQDTYGFDIPVVVRTKQELLEIQQHDIFSKEQVYVLFLEKHISDEQHALLTELIDDEFTIVHHKNIIITLSKSYHQTKYTNTFFEKKLNMHSTARNQNTVNKIIAKME
ncbi:DUF1697 domain-containing protein [Sporosarcina sp. NPDC096371]|uniref:DUF1697 domain-containing protein n=1 Tax=Sporosarcina sp. NPDC096371 TaxID=3364530 RepID=UPI0038101BD3